MLLYLEKNCRLSEAEKMPQLRIQLQRFQKIYRYHIALLNISGLELNKFNISQNVWNLSQARRLGTSPPSLVRQDENFTFDWNKVKSENLFM